MSRQNPYKWMGDASENIILGMMLSVIIPVALIVWFVNVIFYISYSHEGKCCVIRYLLKSSELMFVYVSDNTSTSGHDVVSISTNSSWKVDVLPPSWNTTYPCQDKSPVKV